jgi:small subunit ribosomal protein S8
MTDPIADMLTRIRNANAIGMPTVRMPSTRIRLGLAEVMQREGYIEGFEFEETDRPQNELVIRLKYGPEGEKVIQRIDRASSPGCRHYVKADEIPQVLNGLGITILSTNQGMLSDREAREKHVGGEVVCSIW